MSERIAGVGVTPRSAVGEGVWYDPSPGDGPAEDADETPRTDETATAGESRSPQQERERFERARAAVDEALAAQRERVADRIGEEEAAVFEAHRQFLADPEIESPVEVAIEGGATAGAAVESAFGSAIEQFEGMDGMMADRADDLRDVRDRLLRELRGDDGGLGEVPAGAVVLAERLTPSDTVALDPDRVAGVVTETGGRTSHAAILARSMGLPAVVGVGRSLRTFDGEEVVVDGAAEAVIVDPDPTTVEQAGSEASAPVRHERVTTGDGRQIEVAANVGRPDAAADAAEQGADGVGLFRSEFLFLDRAAPPDEDEQLRTYRQAREVFDAGERVIVRTLDLGGDKPVEYLDLDPTENGFLGARGIRLSLAEHADLFETQLRALLRAAAGEGAVLSVMFPMVTTVEELTAAQERLDAAAAALDEEGVDYGRPEVGVMIETPAAVELAEALAERAAFLSVGTNDLAGYVTAAGRDLDRVADLRDPLQPAVLSALARTVEAGHAGDAWVGICGEMAGDPDLTELLVGLGVDELSASPIAVPELKAAVEDISTAEAERLADRALAAETREEVQEALEK